MSTISFATDGTISAYPNEEATVLTALGHPNALVTDWSTAGDFFPFSSDEEDMKISLELTNRFGFPVTMHTTILEICQFIHDRKSNV